MKVPGVCIGHMASVGDLPLCVRLGRQIHTRQTANSLFSCIRRIRNWQRNWSLALSHSRGTVPQAFVSVNCGALTETLLESELSWHDRGAFTGAHSKRRMGLFEQPTLELCSWMRTPKLSTSVPGSNCCAFSKRGLPTDRRKYRNTVTFGVIAATNRDLARK